MAEDGRDPSEEMNDTTQAGGRPSTGPPKGQAKPKKRSRVGDIIIVVVLAVSALCAAAFFEQIQTACQLQMWSKSGPRTAVAEVQKALESGDLTATRLYLREDSYAITVAGGAITMVKDSRSAHTEPEALASIIPTGSVSDAPMKYDLDAIQGGVTICVDTPSGTEAWYKLLRDENGWYVHQLTPRAGPLP
jgi:hypothetical protein